MKFKNILLLQTLLSLVCLTSFSQEHEKYDIQVLDKVFNYRLKHLTNIKKKNLNEIVIDTSILNLAKKGIYIPTSINLYFENIDSLLEVNLNLLGNKPVSYTHLTLPTICSV